MPEEERIGQKTLEVNSPSHLRKFDENWQSWNSSNRKWDPGGLLILLTFFIKTDLVRDLTSFYLISGRTLVSWSAVSTQSHVFPKFELGERSLTYDWEMATLTLELVEFYRPIGNWFMERNSEPCSELLGYLNLLEILRLDKSYIFIGLTCLY